MDKIFNEIEEGYSKLAEETLKDIVEKEREIKDLETGISTTAQVVTDLKEEINEAEKVQGDSLSDSLTSQQFNVSLDKVVALRMKLDSAQKTLSNALLTLERQKNNVHNAYEDRAGELRDFVADFYAPLNDYNVSLLKKSREICIEWESQAAVLAQKYNIKLGNIVAAQNPLAPLSYGPYAADMKSYITGLAEFEQKNLGKKP